MIKYIGKDFLNTISFNREINKGQLWANGTDETKKIFCKGKKMVS